MGRRGEGKGGERRGKGERRRKKRERGEREEGKKEEGKNKPLSRVQINLGFKIYIKSNCLKISHKPNTFLFFLIFNLASPLSRCSHRIPRVPLGNNH